LNTLRSNNGKSKGQHFSAKRRDFERDECGRFIDDESKNWRPAFQTSLEKQREIDTFVQSRVLRLPTGWPAARYVFDKLNRLSCSELLLMAGPLGLYFLHFCDVDPHIKTLFTQLINCLERLQAKEHTTESLDKLEADIISVLSSLEIALPLNWNSCVRHHLLHLVDFIRRCGPFKTHSMAAFERAHVVFKKLVRQQTHVMKSIAGNYAKLIIGDTWAVKLQQDGV